MSNTPAKISINTKGPKTSSTPLSKNPNSPTNFQEILSSSHPDESKILQQNYDSYSVLASYYTKKDNSSHFMEKISKFNTKFYACSEKYLIAKSNLEKLNDDLYLNLFKQIDCYVEEIQRLNKKLAENENTKDYKKTIKDLNKEILEKKDIIRNLELKISKKTANEERLQKEIESYKRSLIFYKDKIKIRLGARQNNNIRKNNSKVKLESEYIKNSDTKYRHSNQILDRDSSTKNIHNLSVGKENNIKNDNISMYSDKEDENSNGNDSKKVNKKLKESIVVNRKVSNSIQKPGDKTFQHIDKNKNFEELENADYSKNNYSPSTRSFEYNSDADNNNKFFEKANRSENFCFSDNENEEDTKKNKEKTNYKKNAKEKIPHKENETSNKKISQNLQSNNINNNTTKNLKSKNYSASKINCKQSAEYTTKTKLDEKAKIKNYKDNTEARQDSTKKYYKPLIGHFNLSDSKDTNKEKNFEKSDAKKNKNEKNNENIIPYKQGNNLGNTNEKPKKMDKTTSGFSVHNPNIPKPTTSNISRKLTKQKNKNDNELTKMLNELNDDFTNNIDLLSRQEDQIKFMLSLMEK